MLAAARTKPQIAAGLVISPSTVHTHTVHIYAKCGVSTGAGLAMFAMRPGLAARTRRLQLTGTTALRRTKGWGAVLAALVSGLVLRSLCYTVTGSRSAVTAAV